MHKATFLPLIAIALLAGACQGEAEGQARAADAAATGLAANSATAAVADSASPEAEAERELRLTGNGFDTGQPGLHSSGAIDFGQQQDRVIAAVSAIRGKPDETGRNGDCPDGPVEYASFGPLGLHFRDGSFVGWVLDGPADPPIVNEWGVAIGQKRSALGDADREAPIFGESSLGQEFSVEGMGGLLDGEGPDARVSTLFAGVTCFAR